MIARDALRREAASADARRYEERALELEVTIPVAASYWEIASDYWRRAGDSTRAGFAADQAERLRRT